MWNTKKIQRYCEEAFNKAGYDFNEYNITISLNGRLKTTLGRCRSKDVFGIITPFSIEFSKKFIETSTDQNIVDVILHECAHALVAIETNERHGHDKLFKRMCARIGTTNDGTVAKFEAYQYNNQDFKYIIKCDKCGRTLGGYHRAGKVVKNPEHYLCNYCKTNTLNVIQNW